MTATITRRQFLIRAAAATGAVALSCCGLTALGMQAPAVALPSSISSGERKMNQKVLVTYATRTGSTIDVAQAVGKELTQRGFAVDVRPVKEVSSLEGYSAVVLGSAVRFGAWMPEAVKFVEQNQGALSKLPTAFFCVHLMNLGEDDTSRKARQAYLDPIRKLVSPKHEAFFAGVGDPQKVSFIERMIAKMVKSPEGDFRDWNAIAGWAQSILN